ncbi:alpha-N-arabinofuranosidase [Treponema bryantii]|uniref:non-reducing end alpha-L-arabinofuranosidase n=1 Tax=Treponema bryantii TaxID=163 RepID=A0A1H9HP82_9SPIR|nr:alpha-L-arabinofuranosidase C-terminal domain-containing protein [Treponema bryantii]SEQ64125.1 alpha-N-arabinofuranosidase [Treponema bryantii]
MDSIIVNADLDGSQISRDIYGHFSEHLGRCIYGGFWVGKDSEIPNINGYRKDVVEAFKELEIPNLRWPGGCFADEYHWRDGIGPYENRKRMINTHWGGVVEDNSFGTHEFFGLCELLGCKPYVNGNVGSGTVQEMSEWVEYMTFGGESPMSKLREANGHKKPWKLPLFCVGNENWGCGGNMKPEYYADLYRRYQTYVRQYGKDKIFKIACGPNAADFNWTEVLMREAAPLMDGLSLHYYTVEPDWNGRKPACDFTEKDWYLTMRNAGFMETLVRRHDEIMTKYDPDKRVALVVDEWGTWFAVEKGTNPGFLYQQSTIRDALVAGITLNIFNNHSDRVRVANIAQAVNVLQSPVLTEGTKMIKTPTWYVFHMYKPHMDATSLTTRVASNQIGPKDARIDSVSASASHKKNVYTVTLTNAELKGKKEINITLAGLKGKIKEASATILTSKEMHVCNSFDKPNEIKEKALEVKLSGANEMFITVPAMSVVTVQIQA